MKAFLLATAMAVSMAAAVDAADIAPLHGYQRDFRDGGSALVYFDIQPDGFHVVVTTQSGGPEDAKIVRFQSVLAAGQSAIVSTPHELGTAAEGFTIRRIGDRLVIEDPAVALNAGVR